MGDSHYLIWTLFVGVYWVRQHFPSNCLGAAPCSVTLFNPSLSPGDCIHYAWLAQWVWVDTAMYVLWLVSTFSFSTCKKKAHCWSHVLQRISQYTISAKWQPWQTHFEMLSHWLFTEWIMDEPWQCTTWACWRDFIQSQWIATRQLAYWCVVGNIHNISMCLLPVLQLHLVSSSTT